MQGAPGAKQEASTPIAEEKENSFPVFDGDNTIEEQTSIVNESYENSSSWESYEGSSSQEAFEAEKYLDQNNSNVPNDSNAVTADDSNDKYLAIARLDDELENEKWEERTAVITSNDHQVTNWILKCGKVRANFRILSMLENQCPGVHCLRCIDSPGCPRRG